MTKTSCFVLFASLPLVAGTRFGDLPLRFEVNQGQAQEPVQFLARGPGYSMALTAGTARFVTGDREVTLRLAGSDPGARARGEARLETISNYLIGTDHSQWRTGIPNYVAYLFRKCLQLDTKNEYTFFQTSAAKTLGITREGLHKKLRQYGL